jgi:hypothetical protein
MRTLSLLSRAAAVLAAALIGCGGSTPPPDNPDSELQEPRPSDEPAPSWEGASSPEPGPAATSQEPTVDDSIPDDYEMLRGDCVQLGNQLAALTKSDQMVNVSSKLSAAQRAQAEKNIAEVAGRLGDKWAEGCEGSLVGKVVDRKALKCAMDAKTVKDFDACLNATNPPPSGGKK